MEAGAEHPRRRKRRGMLGNSGKPITLETISLTKF
jgi:hypothetical protein